MALFFARIKVTTITDSIMIDRDSLIEMAEGISKGYDNAETAFAIQLWADRAKDFIDCALNYLRNEKLNG